MAVDWYEILKFLHVASSVIWVGGAFVMIVQGIRADRANDDPAMVGQVRQIAWVAERIYVPSSIATLAFGVGATWVNGLWSLLWINLGLGGIAITIGLGILVLTPLAKRIEAGFQAGGATPEVVSASRQLITIAKFDVTLLFTIIAVMVLKPTSSDWVELLIMALVISAAAVIWLAPAFRRSATA